MADSNIERKNVDVKGYSLSELKYQYISGSLVTSCSRSLTCVKACGRTLTPICNPTSTRDARTLWTFVSCACLRTQPRIRDGICTDGCCFPSANAGERPFELRKFEVNLKACESARTDKSSRTLRDVNQVY